MIVDNLQKLKVILDNEYVRGWGNDSSYEISNKSSTSENQQWLSWSDLRWSIVSFKDKNHSKTCDNQSNAIEPLTSYSSLKAYETA